MADGTADGYVEIRGLRLTFSDLGPTDPVPEDSGQPAPALVLVHGLSSNRHIWDLVAPDLARTYRVIALDQRGHGESDQPDTGYDFASIVADLDAFLDALDLHQPVLLVGHSWGASVVLHFAVEHPDRTAAIVLLDGGTSSPGERFTWDEALQRLTPPDIDGLRWEDLYARMVSRNGMYQDPRVASVGRSLFHIDDEGRVSRRLNIPNHLRILRALWEQRPAELLPELTCPVLVLPARQSSDDHDFAAVKVVNVQRALDLQPRARVRWFEETVHDVPLQRPVELTEELLTFANDVFATDGSADGAVQDAKTAGTAGAVAAERAPAS